MAIAYLSRARRLLLAGALGVAAAPFAFAQANWPTQPVKMIVPFPAGGPTDFAARLIAEKLTKSLGQPVVVDNRGGAAGMLGTTALAQSKGDGYTIGLIGNGLVTLTPYVRKDVPFDPLKDLVPLSKAVDIPLLLVANPAVPVKNMKEFIQYAKANPGRMSYGSDGQASLTHLTMEMFKHQQGIHVVHIPYRGTAQLTNDLLANTIQLSMSGIAGPLPHVKSGKLNPLAVTSVKRAAALPDVPTMIELGMKDFDVTTWFSFFAPAGVPAPIAAKLNEHINLVLKDPEVITKLRGSGMEAAPTTQAELDRIVRRYIAQWQDVIKAANIKLED
ncbi:Bug family tripartite tricarboxylate transporter substrate binding protein [Xenophilus azovorans]|uniref:Bug family tripartite tricarboxylate transporter substrate binding protein n=1 Tax=Xenophilus azovorans TaxID=151755 RepID=UPI000570789B|nr:tripartite tricarboxylate transporter substrate binding protein [Xenophilus azovorans]